VKKEAPRKNYFLVAAVKCSLRFRTRQALFKCSNLNSYSNSSSKSKQEDFKSWVDDRPHSKVETRSMKKKVMVRM
jgi:hypothetical protein